MGSREGALEALVAILERSYEDGGKNNTKLQVVAFRALRSLTSDDDHRQLSCAPSAVQNREFCADEHTFPIMRKILRAAMTEPSPAIAQVVLPLMKDACWNQTKIHQLVFEDNILPLVLATMEKAGTSDEPVVKAVLIVLRQFCFSDDMKKLVAYDKKFLPWSLAAVKSYSRLRTSRCISIPRPRPCCGRWSRRFGISRRLSMCWNRSRSLSSLRSCAILS